MLQRVGSEGEPEDTPRRNASGESPRSEVCGQKEVASRATMYVKSEPALLDRFIVELRAVAAGTSEDAELEAI